MPPEKESFFILIDFPFFRSFFIIQLSPHSAVFNLSGRCLWESDRSDWQCLRSHVHHAGSIHTDVISSPAPSYQWAMGVRCHTRSLCYRRCQSPMTLSSDRLTLWTFLLCPPTMHVGDTVTQPWVETTTGRMSNHVIGSAQGLPPCS